MKKIDMEKIDMDEEELPLKIYICKGTYRGGQPCGHQFASSRDPKAKNVHERPQCQNCGKRVNTKQSQKLQ